MAFEKAGMVAEIFNYTRHNETEEAITKKSFEKDFMKRTGFLLAKKIENKKEENLSMILFLNIFI